MDDMEDFLNGGPAAEPQVEETNEPEPQVEAKAEPARGPDGKFIPKGETTDAPPASQDEERVPVAALTAERRKRQELEDRLRALEAAKPPEPQQPPVDMFEDPQGWQTQFGQDVTSKAAFNATLNTSEMLARDKFDDFDEMKTLFLELANENPTVAQQALSDGHPWRKAYQIAKNHQKMTALGATDVSDLETRLREQIRAELEAELKKPAPVQIPSSLAAEQSGQASPLQPDGPPSLADILGR